jgi:DNA primase
MNDLQILSDICKSNLKNSEECLSYLRDERILSDEIIDRYGLGFFPQNTSKLTRFISEESLLRASILDGLGRSQFSDYFYLTFPIENEYGDVVGISGRTLLDEYSRRGIGIPKYKNSSYKKANILYGLNQSKNHILKRKNVYIVEGYFDQISLTKVGIYNSVAICGTAFSKKHFLRLARFTDKMTFLLDSDDAGKESAKRICKKFINRGIKLRFLEAPQPYKDVDEFFRENGKADFFKNFNQIMPDEW